MDIDELNRMRRKRDQAWEMAGLARQDGDMADEARYTNEAVAWSRKIKDYLEQQSE